MKVNIRNDSVVIEGYVNAVERNSKPLNSRMGKFIERIRKGAFSNALSRADDVRVLLNHDWNRDLGGTKDGSLELNEDNIGLHARFETDDKEVMEDARKNNLIGWSFGFKDRPNGVETRTEDGMPLRIVKDMDLLEVSVINRKKVPAYEGTLVTVRAEDDVQYNGEEFIDEVEVAEEVRAEQPKQEAEPAAIDYSQYEKMISEMKGENKNE